MRTSDPAAYDEFILLSGSALNHQFRALYYTHTTTATASFVITYNRVDITTGLVTTTTKTIVINLPSTGGSFLLPISGDAVTATFTSTSTAYALI
jgi:hypothetical protein